MSDSNSGQSTSDTERLLGEDKRFIELAVAEYRNTELEVKLRGPKVTDDEYRERLTATKLAPDASGLHGWGKLEIPADKETLQQFISVLVEASNALHDLEEDRSVETGTFRPVGLHTFAIDEYRYAIHWGDLPDDVDATATGATAAAPATEARVEGVIYARDGSGTHVWVANVGGALADRVVSLADPSTGDVVDSTSVSLDPLARQAVTLDGGS